MAIVSNRLWLHLLAALFVFRVLAQALQAVVTVPLLPAFDAWHGAVFSYPLLLASQIVVIVLLYTAIWRVKAGAIVRRTWKYRACLWLGGLYFGVMATRLVAGLTFLADDPWFSKSLPALFHLVLAGFLLVLGRQIYGEGPGLGAAAHD